MGRRWTAIAVGLGILALNGHAGEAADSGARDPTLKRLEHDLSAGRERQNQLERQSATFKADLLSLRGRLVAASDAATRQQAELGTIEATLVQSDADERKQAVSLALHRREIADLVGALYRLSLTPPEALIARPEAPIDAMRTELLLRTAVPALRERAEALTSSLDRLQELRRRLTAQREQANATRTALAARLAEIAEMVSAREALARETDAERQQNAVRLAALATQATDLRQLFERLEADRRAEAERNRALERQRAEAARARPPVIDAAAPPAEPAALTAPPEDARPPTDANPTPPLAPMASLPTPSLPTPAHPPANQSMRLPVVGRIALAYGDVDRYGVTSRGLHITVQPGTPVVAPMDGTIKFAGRFRTYGQILIVEHPNGYHSLIAGLGRIDTTVGRAVSAGEPLGLVADPVDGVGDLYFELRRNGQPINPRRGIPALDGRGQG